MFIVYGERGNACVVSDSKRWEQGTANPTMEKKRSREVRQAPRYLVISVTTGYGTINKTPAKRR